MDGIRPHFTARTSFSFLLLLLLHTSSEAQNICSAPVSVEIPENIPVGDVVTTITVQSGVTLKFRPSPSNPNNPFRLEGNQLIAARVLDFETSESHVAEIVCTDTATNIQLNLIIVVLVKNVNDNPPVFSQDLYNVDVNEMSPEGTTVGRFPATDLDQLPIFYTLSSESNAFRLMSSTNPVLLVRTPLDYDKVKTVQLILYAQDTPLVPASSKASFTATATIVVTVLDVDNRPPWFQPCVKHEIPAVICQSAGYTGRVFLNEQETGVLPLKPGPLYAIDGDSGINAAMTYSFLSGHGDGVFAIDPSSGNISMLKPADALETISLTVLAAQTTNSYQFATTTVTVSVQMKSLHPPRFQRPQYEGVVTAVGMMAMDPKNKDEPLQILATDDDYVDTGGVNPHITYNLTGSSDFSLIGGYLFMTKALPESTLSLQVMATDTSNDETAIAQLSVEVTSDLTTTSLPLSTTDSMATMSISTTNSKTTEDVLFTTNPSTSTDSSVSTSNPSTSTDSSVSTSNPSTSTDSSVSTSNPITSTDSSVSTSNPSTTSESIISTVSSSTSTDAIISTTIPSTTSESIIPTTYPSMSTDAIISTTIPITTSESIISTTYPSTSTDRSISTTIPGTTSESIISTTYPSASTEGSVSNTSPSVSSEGTIATTNPSLTSEGSVSTASSAHPLTVIISSGGYGSAEMAAVGASLGVLLFICLVVIGVLVFFIRKGKADWRKIYETSIFRSSLGQSSRGPKEGIQYTNDAFHSDEDGGSTGSAGPQGGEGRVMAGGEPRRAAGVFPAYEGVNSVPMHLLLHDSTSQAGSDQADNEKEVKPILTKERRTDEGYKSVWFKEDIDPDAKEEVVIIPDSREDDSDDDEEDEEQSTSGREEEEQDTPQVKTQRVSFNDTDLDSGLGVKMEDPADDSEDDYVLTVDL